MTHQDAVAQIITSILRHEDNVIRHFCLGNPFDKLLRSHDEFTAEGIGLYRKSIGSHILSYVNRSLQSLQIRT